MSSLSSVYRVHRVHLPCRRLLQRMKVVNRALMLRHRLLRALLLSLADLNNISSSTGPKAPGSVRARRHRRGILTALCTGNGSRRSRPLVCCTHCRHTSIRCRRISWVLLRLLCLPIYLAFSSRRIWWRLFVPTSATIPVT